MYKRQLCNNGKYVGAFYLAGYSIELMLKARICEVFGVPGLFDPSDTTMQSEGISELKRMVKTHNLRLLLTVGGLRVKFQADATTNENLFLAKSLLIEKWSEQCRYERQGYVTPTEVIDSITLLTATNGLLQWINNN